MNILVVSSYLPFPLTSGGHIRLYNLLKELSKNHELTLVCEKRKFQTDEDIQEIKKFCKEIFVVNRLKQWSLETIAKTGFSPYPFLITGHRNNHMKKILKKILVEKKFDLIHIETFYVMQNLPVVNIPTVLVEHNLEYLVYRRFAQFAKIALRPLLYIDVLKLWYWERYYWKKATKLVAVSEEEKILMQIKDVAVIPNGVDTHKYQLRPVDEKFKERRILFIGDFKWIQNRDTVRHIVDEIWPLIKKSEQNIQLLIVGKHIPSDIRSAHNGKDIVIDEDAPKETEKIFQKASILLSPIRVGGGTSYKILEAMASGVPVITTSLGIEGINAGDGKEVLIADNPQEFAEKISFILSNEKLYKIIAGNARKLIEEKYDWKIIAKDLEKVYISVLQGNK